MVVNDGDLRHGVVRHRGQHGRTLQGFELAFQKLAACFGGGPFLARGFELFTEARDLLLQDVPFLKQLRGVGMGASELVGAAPLCPFQSDSGWENRTSRSWIRFVRSSRASPSTSPWMLERRDRRSASASCSSRTSIA